MGILVAQKENSRKIHDFFDSISTSIPYLLDKFIKVVSLLVILILYILVDRYILYITRREVNKIIFMTTLQPLYILHI
jgi:hypothetical protein